MLTIVMLMALPITVLAAGNSSLWPSAGQNLHNTRYQSAEHTIGIGNVRKLVKAWEVNTSGDVSATPAVDASNIYFPDAGGSLWALNRATGAVVWHKSLTDYGLPPGDYARTTPVIAGDNLIFGDQGGKFFAGATVMAVSKQTGAPLWKTTVDAHPFAIVTQSAVEDGNVVYVGTASNEEAFAAFIPGYVCCSFRGSVLALNATTGAILWKTYMAPVDYSGNAVWGSTPVIDKERNSLYVTTGNNYSVPDSVSLCVIAAAGDPVAEQACVPPNDYFDSIVALNLTTGAVRWAHRAVPFDAWIVSCILGLPFPLNPNCPDPAGPDYDFGQGPALFTANIPGSGPAELLGAGQKSGQYWALDPDDGSVVWVAQAGPGGIAGGLQWGSATDGKRVFTANANSNHKTWELIKNGKPTGVTTNGGVWSALDAATGKVLWQVANTTPDPFNPLVRAGSNAPVTLANGIVYACSLDSQGHMYAFNAVTGAQLWEFSASDSGSCAAGPAVVQGTVYWGSGYGGFFGIPGHKMRAFKLP